MLNMLSQVFVGPTCSRPHGLDDPLDLFAGMDDFQLQGDEDSDVITLAILDSDAKRGSLFWRFFNMVLAKYNTVGAEERLSQFLAADLRRGLPEAFKHFSERIQTVHAVLQPLPISSDALQQAIQSLQ